MSIGHMDPNFTLWCFTVTLDPQPFFWAYWVFLIRQLKIEFIATPLNAAKVVSCSVYLEVLGT